MRRTLIAIVGATATGKTALGEEVARRLGGEVVCADARQVLRELEIGTGKPTPEERTAQPHRLFELFSLGEQPTAGGWARAAAATCEGCFEHGVAPVLVGGSGLYLAALQRGLHPEPPKDDEVRAALQAECTTVGVVAMHEQLRALDAAAAERLAPRDRQRVLRALEIVRVGGRPLAWWRTQPRAVLLQAEWQTYELMCDPLVLSERISVRTRLMWEQGLLAETQLLIDAGFEPALRQLAAIGYDEALERLAGRMTPALAELRMNERTRQLAKRQRTWFRHQMAAIPLGQGSAGAGASAGPEVGHSVSHIVSAWSRDAGD